MIRVGTIIKHPVLNNNSRSYIRRCFLSSTTTATTNEEYVPSQRFWKKRDDLGRFQRPIFVAATRQHVGKTTCSLAIISGLQKRFDKVGFLKPVGQQHVEVRSSDDEYNLRVDKDCVLIREHFHLDHIDYEHMSPVLIPRGYTKKYVDGEVSDDEQLQQIENAMRNMSEACDIVVSEGTGHCAVGSIVNFNNAKVASLMGSDMVLVANGGLGSAFDELELNRVLCQHYDVRIAGVIINKVMPEKYEQTKNYLSKALRKSWGIPLLGCIPDRPFLGCPALADLEKLFKTKLLTGNEYRYRHYNVGDSNVVTTSLTRFLENLREKPSRTLYICHATRDDLILGFLGECQRRRNEGEKPFEAALIICGRKGKYQISPYIEDMIANNLNTNHQQPIMFVELTTHQTMTQINNFTPKLNYEDANRVSVAVEHYEPYIDFDELLRRTTSSNSSFNDPASISFEQLRKL